MGKLLANIYFKIGVILIITLLLLIPTSMIKSLVWERERTQNSAIEEVSSIWAHEQTLSGPFISIPFTKLVKDNSEKKDAEEQAVVVDVIKEVRVAESAKMVVSPRDRFVEVKDYIQIMPSELNITGHIMPQKRHRGIYEIVVYSSKITVSGKFTMPNFAEFDVPQNKIQFDKSRLTVGIDDLRGIEKQVELNWNGKMFSFIPGIVSNDIVESAINAPVLISATDSSTYQFSFDLELKGSQKLFFTPIGKITDIEMKSEWQNPSFKGAFLPNSSNVTETGFDAKWNVLHLNRNYPQWWIGSQYSVAKSAFGIDLLLPVDRYQKSYRSINYAILFIVFTFLVFFFIEALKKVFIHPIQYILVGIALVVFFTLLLSISEHLNFNLAYIISALATLVLLAGYLKAILKSTSLTLLVIGILSILYTFIFVIIQLQDFALLIGSIGIFVILGLVMYFSRKIEWNNLNFKNM